MIDISFAPAKLSGKSGLEEGRRIPPLLPSSPQRRKRMDVERDERRQWPRATLMKRRKFFCVCRVAADSFPFFHGLVACVCGYVGRSLPPPLPFHHREL